MGYSIDLSQIDAVTLLPNYKLPQKRNLKRLQPGRFRIYNSPTHARRTGFKGIGERIIDRWTVQAVDEQTNIIITVARRYICAIAVIYTEVQHVELLPRFALAALIGVTNIYAFQVIGEYRASEVIVNGQRLRR